MPILRKKTSSSNYTSNKSKGYQPQISLNRKDQHDKKLAQPQSNNNRNLIEFNFNDSNQDKNFEITSLPKTDMLSFTGGNEVPTINSKKQSEFNFINNRKTNSPTNMQSTSNLIDINSDNIPTKLKTLHENINKLYSNNEYQAVNNGMESSSIKNFSSFNNVTQQPNINIQNTYYQFYDNTMNNQMGVNINNRVNSGYNPNQYHQNGYNNTLNGQNGYNNYNSINNYANYSNIPSYNFNNQGSLNGNYQGNMSYNDYTFGLTPTVGVSNNQYLNFTDEKDKKTKNEDPFKNLVSFK